MAGDGRGDLRSLGAIELERPEWAVPYGTSSGQVTALTAANLTATNGGRQVAVPP